MFPFFRPSLPASLPGALDPRARAGLRRGPFGLKPRVWLLIEISLFVFTLALFWLLSSRAAGEEPARSPAAGPRPDRAEFQDRLSYRDLALFLVERFRSRPGAPDAGPAIDPELVKVRLYDLVMGAAADAGPSEDPRRRLEAISRELFERRGFHAIPPPPEGYGAEHLLLDQLQVRRSGAPLSLALLYLAVGELLSPALELKPLVLTTRAAIHYQDGSTTLAVLLGPGEEGRIVREDLLRARWEGEGLAAAGRAALRPLKRSELAGAFLSDLAHGLLSRGELEGARALLLEAAAIGLDRPALLIESADLAREAGDLEAARSALDAALALDHDHPRALARRGTLLFGSGELEAAERDLERAVALDPHLEPEAIALLGDLERRRGRDDLAIAAYRRCLERELKPDLRDRIRAHLKELELRPVLATLRGKAGYPAKFEALRRVAAAPSPAAAETLIGALGDENLRFARLAWRTLRQVTGQDLGFDPAVWERWWSSRERAGQPQG